MSLRDDLIKLGSAVPALRPHLGPILREHDQRAASQKRAAQGGDILEGYRRNGRVIAPKADLRNADLRNADLKAADFSGTNLGGADLRGANLEGAWLEGANLHGARLGGANLAYANLYGCRLVGANLQRANLTGADLARTNLTKAFLIGARMDGADLTGAILTGAKMDGPARMAASQKTALDQTSVRELHLYLEDEGSLYRQKQAIEANQRKHWARGQWNLAGSIKGFMYLVDEAAKRYVKEFGNGRVQDTFPKPERMEVARLLALDFQEEMGLG